MSGGRTKFAAVGREADTVSPASELGGGGPLGGVTGKLMPGTYQVTVLSLTRQDHQVAWIVETPAKMCHYEVVEWLPHEIQVGSACKVTVIPAAGFYWKRAGGRVQPWDADSQQPVVGYEDTWFDDMGAGYMELSGKGLRPCTTKITEVVYNDTAYAPKQV